MEYIHKTKFPQTLGIFMDDLKTVSEAFPQKFEIRLWQKGFFELAAKSIGKQVGQSADHTAHVLQ